MNRKEYALSLLRKNYFSVLMDKGGWFINSVLIVDDSKTVICLQHTFVVVSGCVMINSYYN